MQPTHAECAQENAPPLGRCKLPVQHRHTSSHKRFMDSATCKKIKLSLWGQKPKCWILFCKNLAVNNLHYYHQQHLHTEYPAGLIKTARARVQPKAFTRDGHAPQLRSGPSQCYRNNVVTCRQYFGRDAEECSRDQLHPGSPSSAEPELSKPTRKQGCVVRKAGAVHQPRIQSFSTPALLASHFDDL